MSYDTVLFSKNRPVLSTESQNFLKDPSPRPEFRVANLALIAFALLRGPFSKSFLAKSQSSMSKRLCSPIAPITARFNCGTILRNIAILIKGTSEGRHHEQ
jgi:hypothetical protein